MRRLRRRGNRNRTSPLLHFFKVEALELRALLQASPGVVIDNDIPIGTLGRFEIEILSGGESRFANLTADGHESGPLTEDVLFDYLSYVDTGNGGAFRLNTGTPVLTGDDEVTSSGSFDGSDENVINWSVVSSIADESNTLVNRITFSAEIGTIGSLRFYQYLDEDLFDEDDDVFYARGSADAGNLELFTVDNVELFGVSHGGVYSTTQGLVNATFAGWAADRFDLMRPAIQGPGQPVSQSGVNNIGTSFVHPDLDGLVHGPTDVVSVLAWDVDRNATTATLVTTLGGIPDSPPPPTDPASIHGYKFEDLNGNGIDDDEPRLGGVDITLDDGVNPPITVLTDDETGEYGFMDLGPGTFTVTETPPDGSVQTTTDPAPITLSAGQEVMPSDEPGLAFGNFFLAEIRGYKFDDLNGNGIDDGEPRLADVDIHLNDGINPAVTVSTDDNGEYVFRGLQRGTYTVSETTPPGSVQTTIDPAPIPIFSGDVVDEAVFPGLAFGNTSINLDEKVGRRILVASDGEVIARYEGVSPSTQFSNDLLLDTPTNGLGILFNNKTSTVGDTVNLGNFTAGTELIFRLHVNDTGIDFFTGPGFRNPDGLPHARVNDMVSPAFVEFEDLFGNPEGSGGFNDLFFSFTNVIAPPLLTEISGYKFEDLNGNEIDDGEPRLAGVEITLNDGVNPPITVLTDESGEYSFLGVPDGTYTVTETVPDGFISTTLNPGPITISNGQVVTPEDETGLAFGNFRIPSIARDVFEPNDSSNTAKSVRTGETMASIHLNPDGSPNDDWFVWTAPSDGIARMNVRAPTGDGRLRILVFKNGFFVGDNNDQFPVKEGEEFRIEISPVPSTNPRPKYTLSIGLDAAPTIDSFTADDIPLASSATAADVQELSVTFSEPVSGFDDVSVLQLTRTTDQTENIPLDGVTLSSSDNQTFVLGNLGPLTMKSGIYRLNFIGAEGIVDSSGNVLAGNSQLSWTNRPGDANEDGVFDFRDVFQVLLFALYKTGRDALWSQGNWQQEDEETKNDFDELDIMFALQPEENYQSVPTFSALSAVIQRPSLPCLVCESNTFQRVPQAAQSVAMESFPSRPNARESRVSAGYFYRLSRDTAARSEEEAIDVLMASEDPFTTRTRTL